MKGLGQRLELDINTVIVHLQEITQIAEQRRQLIKRMEPLAEENEKLKEAMNLSERNIQRVRREPDLVESNAWDLEYQRGSCLSSWWLRPSNYIANPSSWPLSLNN